jgi:hypothetical protein
LVATCQALVLSVVVVTEMNGSSDRAMGGRTRQKQLQTTPPRELIQLAWRHSLHALARQSAPTERRPSHALNMRTPVPPCLLSCEPGDARVQFAVS